LINFVIRKEIPKPKREEAPKYITVNQLIS